MGKARMNEQLTIMPLREPCGRLCEAEWGSLRCLEKNGLMYDHQRRQFIRASDGRILVSNNRECDWRKE